MVTIAILHQIYFIPHAAFFFDESKTIKKSLNDWCARLIHRPDEDEDIWSPLMADSRQYPALAFGYWRNSVLIVHLSGHEEAVLSTIH
jgi:hypothetical protein